MGALDDGVRTGVGSKDKEKAPDGPGLDSTKRQRLSSDDLEASRISSPSPAHLSTPPDVADDSRAGAPARASPQGIVGVNATSDAAPERVASLVSKIAEFGGCVTDADAALALKKFDDKLDMACGWLLAESTEEKERLEHEHDQHRRREQDDLRMALSLQDEEEKWQQNLQLQKDRERERETAKKTGQVGCLFERTTRKRGAPKLLKEHVGGVSSRRSRESHGGADRGRGDGAVRHGTSGRSAPPTLGTLSDGALERVERHKFLQRPIMFQGKVGSVCEAYRDATGAAYLMVRLIDDCKLCIFEEADFVTEFPDHFQSVRDRVLLLPAYLHLRGAMGRPLHESVHQQNEFHYETNVVCSVPANNFGKDFEYIQFQILDADTVFSVQERMALEEELYEARIDHLHVNDEGVNGEREKEALRCGPQYRLRIFDTGECPYFDTGYVCRCNEGASTCICKKNRGWGVMADEDIPKGSVVMEYVGAVKLKPGKSYKVKSRTVQQMLRPLEEGEQNGEMLLGAHCEAADSSKSARPRKAETRNLEVRQAEEEKEEEKPGIGATMTCEEIVKVLIGQKFKKKFKGYGEFEGHIESYGEIVKDSFHIFYPEDGDRESMKIDKLTKTIVNFLDPNIGQMVKDFVRAQEARRCMPADFAVAAKQGSADGDGAGADGSSAFGEHSLPQMDGHMHEDSEGECRGHTGDAGNDEVLERSGSPSNVGIEDDANASRHSSSSSVAGGSGEVDGIVLEKEHVTNTGMNIHGGAHSNVAATHEDEEVACSVRLDDDEKAHQEVEVEERGPAGMDSKNYVFDFQKSNWIVDATEKGNVGRFVNHACENNNLEAVFFLAAKRAYHLPQRIALLAVRDIVKGEELTYDYVTEYQESRKAKRYQEGVKCLCGQPACRKFIWGAR